MGDHVTGAVLFNRTPQMLDILCRAQQVYGFHETVVVIECISTAFSESRRVIIVVSASLTTLSKTAFKLFLASLNDTIFIAGPCVQVTAQP